MRTLSPCQPGNLYDDCLLGQSVLVGKNITPRRRSWPGGAPPWVSMPASGQRFQRVVSSVLPAVESVTNLLLAYRVPQGYAGVLLTITTLFTSSGFIEGSGDIVWRVQDNFRYLKDLGTIQVSMGDLEYPYSLEGGGYRLSENEYIKMYVMLGAGSLGRLDPDGRIVAGITGWIYPQKRG